MDSASVSNLLTPIGLGMIALGVSAVSFLAIRNFSTTSRRRARLAGGAAAAVAVDQGGGVGEALSGVVSRRAADRRPHRHPGPRAALRAAGQARAGRLLQPRGRGGLPGRQGDADDPAIIGIALLLPYALSKHGGIGAVAIGGAIAIAAIMGPDQVIGNRRNKREREYREGFPDLLDLLVASVEAGPLASTPPSPASPTSCSGAIRAWPSTSRC